MELDLESFEGVIQKRKRSELMAVLSQFPVRAEGFTRAPAPAESVILQEHFQCN